jgi:glyoxylase-like metal-dependent hydrolase (beta-lactamase superfamily II)
MNAEIHSFRLGKFDCMAVSDGTMTYAPPMFPPPATFLFLNAEAESRSRALGDHGLEEERWAAWKSGYTCLVVDIGKHLVLVDTGAGALGPDTGKLIKNLRSVSIAPGNIDTVILTHGHPDHIGGVTDEHGRTVYNNARYFMWKTEWDFWTSSQADAALDEHSRTMLTGIARKNLPPIQKQVELVSDEAEIVPGIRAIAAPGHTPGQMALEITSGGETLLYMSDVFLHPIHLEHPGWCSAVDLIPGEVVATRKRLLEKAAADEALVLAFHLPFPALGRVVAKGGAWSWQPLAS